MTVRARIFVVCLLLTLAAAPATASALTVGISDQQASAWQDMRLQALGVRYARISVPWDAATSEPAAVQAWLDAVAAAGAQPHVAFEHLRSDRCPGPPCVTPTRTQYRRAVDRFIARFPQVRTYTTWNEANHTTQPVSSDPAMVESYWEELTAACPACTVVAGDVVDSGSYVRFLERFQEAGGAGARLWGLHNYSDVTYGTTSRTDAALAAVTGDLWIEETGGLVTRHDAAGRLLFTASENDAAAAVDQAFAIAKSRARITRMYVYQWKAWPRDTFDAGLVRPDGTARPSYDAMKRNLAALPRWRPPRRGRYGGRAGRRTCGSRCASAAPARAAAGSRSPCASARAAPCERRCGASRRAPTARTPSRRCGSGSPTLCGLACAARCAARSGSRCGRPPWSGSHCPARASATGRAGRSRRSAPCG